MWRWKKIRLHFLFTVGKDFATEFHLSIHQTLIFNNCNFFGKLNLKCDCKIITVISLPFFWKFLCKRFEFNLVCMEFQHWKNFLRLYSQLKTKRVRMKTCLQCLHFSLRYSATHFHLKLRAYEILIFASLAPPPRKSFDVSKKIKI